MPGHLLIFDTKNFHTTVQSVKKECKVSLQKNEEETIRHLDALLTEVVSDHLVSDVPLGALLSGGIDSSLVVALMQKINTSPVRTFSIGFREKGYNEATWAAGVAGHLGTDHTELYVTPHDAVNVIPILPDIYDEPFADPSAIPSFLVSQLTRSCVTVALSGDGGDEQFAGYVRYWSTRAIERIFRHIPKTLKKSLASVLNAIPSTWIEKCYLPFQQILPQHFRVTNFPDKWQKLLRTVNQEQIQELYRMTICLWSKEELENLLLCQDFHIPESQYEKTFEDTKDLPLLSRLMQVDQNTYLPDAMLTKVDRASMAVGLEIRVPLLDRRVLEYSYQIPDYLKYRDGAGKYILKQVLARYVPGELFERPKMGFGVPIDRWFRNELKMMLRDYLSSERLKREGLFNHHLIEKMIKEHLSGKCNHQYRLWAVLMWEMWRERWI